jgi:L-ascorbate 6-phosphate lactonase
MIQPIQTGTALLKDIETARPGPGEVAVWWLGQSGYAIKTASALLYIDLYLSEHLTAKYAGSEKPHVRMTEAPLRGKDITNADWVFASHKHSDHLDPGTMPDLLAASPHARLVLPAALVDYAVSLGLPRERLIPTRGDEIFQVGPISVHSVPSAHPDLDHDEANGYPFLGYVLTMDGLTLYHSGDSLAYDGLAERLRPLEVDIAFLPINGTDARRTALKVPPNMNVEEVVDLARAISPRLVIPHHYDMFTFNTVDVREFTRRADAVGLPYAVLRCGERFTWRKPVTAA